MTQRLTDLENVLRDLAQRCPIEAAAIVTMRGQMVCSLLTTSTPERAMSAMAASIQSIGERVGRELGAGRPKTIIIDGSAKSVILTGFGSMILVGTAPVNAAIALIKFELQNAIEKIRAILGE